MTNDSTRHHGEYSSYMDGREPSKEHYAPKIVGNGVRIYPSGIKPEYATILPYRDHEVCNESDRILYIKSDTFIEMNSVPAEVSSDARFIFNALLANRHIGKGALDLLNFEYGFRGECYTRSHNSVSTLLARAVSSLDAWALQASDDILVSRTGWGTGSHPKYAIASDIRIYDERSRN